MLSIINGTGEGSARPGNGPMSIRVRNEISVVSGVDLVVMGEIGEAFEDAEQVLVPKAAQDLHIAGAALRAEPGELVATLCAFGNLSGVSTDLARREACHDHHQMSAPINIAGPVEIVRDGDLLAASLAQRHSTSAAPRPRRFRG
jgi:hypothetical protein